MLAMGREGSQNATARSMLSQKDITGCASLVCHRLSPLRDYITGEYGPPRLSFSIAWYDCAPDRSDDFNFLVTAAAEDLCFFWSLCMDQTYPVEMYSPVNSGSASDPSSMCQVALYRFVQLHTLPALNPQEPQ